MSVTIEDVMAAAEEHRRGEHRNKWGYLRDVPEHETRERLRLTVALLEAETVVKEHAYDCPGPVTCTGMHERIDKRDEIAAKLREVQ